MVPFLRIDKTHFSKRNDEANGKPRRLNELIEKWSRGEFVPVRFGCSLAAHKRSAVVCAAQPRRARADPDNAHSILAKE